MPGQAVRPERPEARAQRRMHREKGDGSFERRRTACWTYVLMRRGAEVFRFRVFGVAESQRAYVKIEARILAPARAGRYHTFVLFAANIPGDVESFGAGALAGKCPVAGAPGICKKALSFSGAIPGTRRGA